MPDRSVISVGELSGHNTESITVCHIVGIVGFGECRGLCTVTPYIVEPEKE